MQIPRQCDQAPETKGSEQEPAIKDPKPDPSPADFPDTDKKTSVTLPCMLEIISPSWHRFILHIMTHKGNLACSLFLFQYRLTHHMFITPSFTPCSSPLLQVPGESMIDHNISVTITDKRTRAVVRASSASIVRPHRLARHNSMT